VCGIVTWVGLLTRHDTTKPCPATAVAGAVKTTTLVAGVGAGVVIGVVVAVGVMTGVTTGVGVPVGGFTQPDINEDTIAIAAIQITILLLIINNLQ
ncbi:MAG: hypothetical protein O8C64_00200, partial [Candidatus Methanoperedens sp.]|nr:hypothetical protein [Candidatus Methanoperedens sp.]